MGFVAQEDGPDVVVHYSEVDGDGYRSLEDHQRLEFDVNQDPKGRRPPAFASSDPDGSGNPSHAAQ